MQIDVFRIDISTLSFSGLIEPTDDHGDCLLGREGGTLPASQ
jgi:hypothetical protein